MVRYPFYCIFYFKLLEELRKRVSICIPLIDKGIHHQQLSRYFYHTLSVDQQQYGIYSIHIRVESFYFLDFLLFCCVLLYLFSILSCFALIICNIYPISCNAFNLSDPLKKNLLTRHTLLNFFFSNTSFSDAQHDYISCSCQLSVKECF